MNNTLKITFFGLFLFVTIIFSYIFSEDTLGGAKNDYLFHEKFIVLFASDFFETFKNYGQGDLYARNSPIFYIILSFLHKLGINLENIRYLNIVSIPIICYLFYECLIIKFKKIDTDLLKFFALVIFLSPTIRSLVIWPYPILYAFLFFLLTLKFFLKFTKEKNCKLTNALKCTFFYAVTSYITPNFCVFAIFFIYQFYLEFKSSKEIKYILIFNFFLALPAFFYYYKFDFYIFNYSVYEVNNLVKYNIFNKILVITSLIFFYFLPFLKINIVQKFFNEFKNLKNNYLIYILAFICIYFFNLPEGFGGGIFYHVSLNLFSNNYFLFLIFFISLLIFKSADLFNINNIIIFICLILYNLQISIYHKYFDPLLLFILLFLLSYNKKILKIDIFKLAKNYYYLYLFFLGISFYKVIFLI